MIRKKACPEQSRRVFVGMSGGVDSSVSAAILKRAGYDVTGIFIRVWEPFDLAQGGSSACNWREERRWARRVAAHLNIPLITLDLSNEYKKRVVDYFVSEYKAGRTPNPDVMCNKYIKFGLFYDWAMENGADYVATGHYARIIRRKADGYRLLAGKDKNKDQSYFLWNIKHDQLPHILFPVGVYTKPKVRKLATEFKLPTADKKDSQGLCFVGKIDFKQFLKQQIKPLSGNVINDNGDIIGRHPGATLFTIGERHGFEIFSQAPDARPYFVVDKNISQNTITVSNKLKINKAEKKEVMINNSNWVSYSPPVGLRLWAKLRYRQELQPCQLLDTTKGQWRFSFIQPQLVVPGQSLVLYDKEGTCLGGGEIA